MSVGPFPGTTRRWVVRGMVAIAVLAIVAAVGYGFAARALERQVIAALGPHSQVERVALGLGGIEVTGLRVRAPHGWPAPEVLAARRVLVVPDLRSLLSSTVRVSRVVIEDGYLSALRTGDGKVQVLPGLIGAAAQPTPGSQPPAGSQPPSGPKAPLESKAPQPMARDPNALVIGQVTLRNGTVEFFDASVRRPPLRLRVQGLDVEVADLAIPSLVGRSSVRLDGFIAGTPDRGAARRSGADGRVHVDGWIEFASRDSQLTTRLRSVDLVTLQPYLIKAAETGVRAGTLDLDLESKVSRNRVRAPGRLVLSGLELSGAGGSNTFMGLPRQAVIALFRDGRGRIELDFVLQGQLDDPRFSVSEDLAIRAATSLAAALGISLEGVVRGLGGVGQKSGDAAGEAARSLGSALRGLFGR